MRFLRQRARFLCQAIKQRLRQWTKPNTLPVNAVLDITRSKSELVLENVLLRQQLIILQRQTKRPRFTWRDRALFVFLASKLRTWKEALIMCAFGHLAARHRVALAS
jgi:putative transposase